MTIQYERLSDKDLTFDTVAHVVNKKHYIELYCGFDIETTNIPEEKLAFLYIWQFSINDVVVIGHTWGEFVALLERIKRIYTLRPTTRLIVWVANLSFEFQFFRHWVNVTSVFAKEKRQPLEVVVDDCIEFRDCLAISGGNLSQLAKDYTKTQKLTGDLDYNVRRNTTDGKNLTPKELAYCENDVIILSEFSEFIFKTYIQNGFLPLTKTGILRRKVKEAVKEHPNSKRIRLAISESFPSKQFYRVLMNYCFRGGYVHANAFHTDKVIENVYSVDFTSSYPSVMFKSYVPCSNFYKQADTTFENFEKHTKTHCVIADVTFKNIRTKTPHSIESKNKIVEFENAIWDNGRLQRADLERVVFTELDYLNYTMFYEWEEVTINSFYIATRGFLPRYFLNILGGEYCKKAHLKKTGQGKTKEYAIAKSVVNSSFGLTVTRMNENDITYENGEWGDTTANFNYEKEASKSVLLPQWGVYICAQARHNLLRVCYEIDKDNPFGDVLYNDTDSIKIKNFEKYRGIIEAYNEEQERLNRKICEDFGFDFELFNDLGKFEIENHGKPFERFKTLGAKRYLTESCGEYEVTVAGLPKTTITKYVAKVNVERQEKGIEPLDVFDFFDDDMELSLEDSQKLTTAYNDEASEYIVNGEKMTERSSVCLYSIPFKLSLAKDYREFCEMLLAKLTERKKL